MTSGRHKKAGKGKSKKGESRTGFWPVTYKWVAAGTLVAYSALGSRTVTLAAAQARPSLSGEAASGAETSSTQPVHHFDIPAGPLGEALDAFQKATQIHVILAEDAIRTLDSPGVSGDYTDEQALERLLAGTRVNYKFAGPMAVRLEIAALSQSVSVTASDLQVEMESPKFAETLLDTPQTIGTVSQHVMAEQGTTTLRDALRNVAGISLAAGEGGSQGDNLTIRGFTARNDIFLDGMRDFGSYYRDPFNLESLAVLQGPSSVLFGRGSTGGVVSQVSKTARMEGLISGSVDLGSDPTRRFTLDIDEPVPALGSHTAFRLNLMGQDSDVAGRDVATNRRYGVAPTLTFGIGTPTRLTFSYFHEWEDDIPDYGIPWFFDHPAQVPRNNFYGFEEGNFLKTSDDVGTIRLEHDFGTKLSLRSQLRYANYPREAVITEPQVNAPNTPTTPLENVIVTRNQISVNSVESFLDEQTDVSTSFNTGSLRHTFVAGVEWSRETSNPTRFAFTGVPTTSLLNPDPTQFLPQTYRVSSLVHATAYTIAGYALDTVALGRKWQLTGGIRYDRFSAAYSQAITPVTHFDRVDNLPSWRTALLYKPKPNGSIYFAYGTSFNPSAETLSLSAANANLPPEHNQTFEIGTKWDLGTPLLTLGGALFRTEKTNAREPDPNNPLLNVLSGTQRVDGVEANITGHLTRRWELLAGYAHLHSEVVESKAFPASVGYPLANVPANTFNFWSSYHTPWRNLEFGAGGNFVDSRTASSTVPLNPVTGLLKQIPGYWVFNAMVRYPVSEYLDLQLNAYNLADNYYYDEPHPNHIIPGAGRAVLGSLRFKFPQKRK